MRGFQGAGDLDCQPHDLFSLQRTAQRIALDVFQHEIVRSNVVDLADVRMVQRGDGAGLLFKPRAIGTLELLDRDGTTEPRLTCLPHLSAVR